MILRFIIPVTASTSGDASPQIHNAWVLFTTVAVLLAILFAVIALTALVRWRRNRTPRSLDTGAPDIDAWAEAGRRAEPYQRTRKRG